MANRYFNKQTTNARQALADGGPAEKKNDPRGTGKSQRPKPDLRPRQPSRPMPSNPPKRKNRPSLGDDVAPRNPRKKLKPFPNQAVPDRPTPKTGRPLRPMPKDRMEPRKPMPKLPGKPSGPKGLTPDQIKRLKELMKKRKSLDPKNPKLKKSIDDLKNQIRQRPKTMIPLKSKKMGGKK